MCSKYIVKEHKVEDIAYLAGIWWKGCFYT